MPTEINGYSPSQETPLSSLVINEVDSTETFEKMKEKGLLQDNQLYLVTDEQPSAGIDEVPTEGSKNLVYSGGVYDALKQVGSADSVTEQNKGLKQKFWRGTKAEFEAVETKSDDTMYIIVDDDGTIPTPDVSGQINAHNTNIKAHSDIRKSITDLTTSLQDQINSKQEALSGTAGQVVGFDENGNPVSQDFPDGCLVVKNLTPNLPEDIVMGGIGFGNGKFIILPWVGTTGAYSEDGITWTTMQMPSNDGWDGIVYGGNKFVAVAWSNNSAAYSSDGINWTRTTLPGNTYWDKIAYGNEKFVAISGEAGGKKVAAYSSDGITWTQTTLPTDSNWKDVTFGNGKFVAIGSYNQNDVAYSSDGKKWTTATLPNPGFSTYFLNNVAFYKGNFYIITANSSCTKALIYKSSDAINWTYDTFSGIIAPNKTTCSDDKLVCLSNNYSSLIYTKDGINWNHVETEWSGGFFFPAYGNGKYICCIRNDNDELKVLLISNDGISWGKSISQIATTSGVDVKEQMKEALGVTTVQTDNFVSTSEKGTANGVATLGADGKVPVEQLPTMNYAPAYTYGTEDLTAGTSALETGKMYIVYEP